MKQNQENESTQKKAYLNEFVQQIANLPSKEKMAQIGIESSVLGMPRDNINFAKAKSYFLDAPFDTTETTRVPKQWLEFTNLQPPISIISSMPDLTLLFMFYAQPRDLIQITASEELQNRGWNYDESEMRWSYENEGDIFEFDLHSWSVKKKPQEASQ
ncbi:hypothetical protein TRFO_16708 [Tritrichomonas foetus]|uniref:NOT2/NOT3/NOT5 C-terminal domain-containing protein n=1 Tax=Tritrichomonas foetus TaxID=1144522 RepID=A0A1J4KUS3_9EUKA|nr:hypothetical protein TRFO_16708 [Tritrichomonas foetus]|eukprot:OHT13253.1 hypothetical protein TRFO_16708 [Tritrichomonas foetus]